MTILSTLALSLASSLAASGATALYFRSRLSAAKASARLFKACMVDAETRALRAEARLDLAHEKHVAAGKAAHAAQRALRDATTEALRLATPNPPRPRHEIEAEVAALRAARRNQPLDGAGRGVCPASSPAREGESPSAPLSNSCGGSAAPKADESGGTLPVEPTGRGAVPSRRRPSGSRPGIRPAKPAGETARLILPAEIPQTKGA